MIDYGICSTALLPTITSFYVLPYTILSDHCCVSLNLDVLPPACASLETEETDTLNLTEDIAYPHFKPEFAGMFLENLEKDTRFDEKYSKLENGPVNQPTIDEMVEMFNTPLLDNAKKSFPAEAFASLSAWRPASISA